MQQYFEVRWQNDKNQALRGDENQKIYMQIPENVQNKLFNNFLFHDFLQKFCHFFKMSNSSQSLSGNKFTWQNQVYRNFMMDLLHFLEPRQEPKNTILVDELEEHMEIIFVSKGTIVLGYEINKQKRYCIKYKDKCVVGAFGLTFNQRSSVIWNCLTSITGYSIRKNNWLKLLEEKNDITIAMKKNILMHYIAEIRSKVLVNKKKAIEEMKDRQDHQMILVSQFKEHDRNTKQILSQNLSSQVQNNAIEATDEIQIIEGKIENYADMAESFLENVDRKENLLLSMSYRVKASQWDLEAAQERIRVLEEELRAKKKERELKKQTES